MLLELCLGVLVFKTCFLTHSPTSHLRHFTNTFCVTPLTVNTATAQLRPIRDRPMFAAVDFKHNDVRFNVRWST